MGALTSAIWNGFAMLQGLMQQRMHQPLQDSWASSLSVVSNLMSTVNQAMERTNNSQQNSYKSYLDDDNF